MNKKLVFFFLSALAIAGCAKEPQTGDSVGTDAQDANFSILASSDVFKIPRLSDVSTRPSMG